MKIVDSTNRNISDPWSLNECNICEKLPEIMPVPVYVHKGNPGNKNK
jgi:hypothetical protein